MLDSSGAFLILGLVPIIAPVQILDCNLTSRRTPFTWHSNIFFNIKQYEFKMHFSWKSMCIE